MDARSGALFRLAVELEESGSADDKTIRVFSRQQGEFYQAFGRAAEFIADTYFNTREVIKRRSDSKEDDADEPDVCWVSLRPQKVRTIVLDAVVKRHMVLEVWENTGTASANGGWQLVARGSPGNIAPLEDALGLSLAEGRPGSDGSTGAEPTAVMAVKVGPATQGECLVGAALVDNSSFSSLPDSSSSRALELCEFVDDDRFSNFRSLVAQVGVRECLLPEDAPADAVTPKLAAILEEAKVCVTRQKRAQFGSSSLEQDLKRLCGSLHQQNFVLLENKTALDSLAALISYMGLLQDDSGHGRYQLRSRDLSQYMRLDTAAVNALNLFPQASDSNRNMCLFGLLNKCRTASGSRLLGQWLKQPLLNLEELEKRLNYVQLFVEDMQLRQALQDNHLKGVPDLQRLAKRFTKGQGTLETLVSLYRFVLRLGAIVGALEEHEGPHAEALRAEFVDGLRRLQKDFSKLEALVEQTVDLKALENHEYLINPSFNDELKKLSEEKQQLLDDMEAQRSETVEQLDIEEAKLKLNHHAQHGYHFRVSRKDERFLRNHKFVINLETRKDGVHFTTSQLRQLSRRFEELSSQYQQQQAEIVRKCMEVVASYTPIMEEAGEVLGKLDVLVSLAHVAASAPTPYCRPKLLPMGSGTVHMVKARHPCLEVQDNVAFIPNDVSLEHGRSNVQLITGPNMGGKSTFIRQVGVIVLMAQVGSFVPCDSATISLVDCILARVGAGDLQLRGVSTFMKEMLEAASILKATTKNSLIIIDELGRGTSTYDGFGLAWAIAEHIAKNIEAFTLFATHFHELTALAEEVPSVVNKHVTAHTTENSITMLYTVQDGPCDRSFGIHVSELAQFPASVVAMAKRKAMELEDFGSQAERAMGAATDDDSKDGESSSKRARPSTAEETEQHRNVVRFLQSFAALPHPGEDGMDEQTFMQATQSLVQSVAF